MPTLRFSPFRLPLRQYHHVFATHSNLQAYLCDGIIRQENIDPETVLVLRVRGSYREGETAAYPILNGGDYRNQTGLNLLKHRRTNRQRYANFKRDVLDRLAPDFQVYSPMYTYWFLRVLASRAGEFHVLEDGFGSYQSREELKQYFDLLQPEKWSKKADLLRIRLLTLPEQKAPLPRGIEMLDGVARSYATSAACFPWLPEERRRVVKEVFPPERVGEFAGETIWATSCLVETGYVALPVYLDILRAVLSKIADRGITEIYLKWHPVQSRHPEHLPQYRAVVKSFADRLRVRELTGDVSLECLAAGNAITFITGISTLAFHVASTGAKVYNYHADIELLAPGSTNYLARNGVEIFHRLSDPL